METLQEGDTVQVQTEEYFIRTYGERFRQTYSRGWVSSMDRYFGKIAIVTCLMDNKVCLRLPGSPSWNYYTFNLCDIVLPLSLIDKPQKEFKVKKKIVQEI